MPTRAEWEHIISGRGGKLCGIVQLERILKEWDFIDGNWFYYNRGDEKKKPLRYLTAREMRKDGWEVKTETNTLGYFIHAKRRKK